MNHRLDSPEFSPYNTIMFCSLTHDDPFLSRRRFLSCCKYAAAAGAFMAGDGKVAAGPALFEARFYDKLEGAKVRCRVCPRECVIAEGGRGMCNTRENRGGVLYSLVYGEVASFAADPIEKKPLYHVSPGSKAFSIATAGCNLWCKFCQNYTLSQSKPEDIRSVSVTPDQLAREAEHSGSAYIAYTYNEPTVFAEYVRDCAEAGKKAGVGSVVISNGFINPGPLDSLAEVVDAYKIDLKAFSDEFYRTMTGGRLKPVLDTIKRLKHHGIWTELVHLTIPTLNDGESDLREMGRWLAGEVGPDVPVHFTRFHPMYRLTSLPVTPVSTLERARDILMDAGVRYVYIGNVPGHEAGNTVCHSCGKTIVKRLGYGISAMHIVDGTCEFCKTAIPGVWS